MSKKSTTLKLRKKNVERANKEIHVIVQLSVNREVLQAKGATEEDEFEAYDVAKKIFKKLKAAKKELLFLSKLNDAGIQHFSLGKFDDYQGGEEDKAWHFNYAISGYQHSLTLDEIQQFKDLVIQVAKTVAKKSNASVKIAKLSIQEVIQEYRSLEYI